MENRNLLRGASSFENPGARVGETVHASAQRVPDLLCDASGLCEVRRDS